MMKVLFLLLVITLAMPAGAQSDKRKGPANKAQDASAQSCEEQKRLYRQSEACFARYRDPATKVLHPKAFSQCKEMKQPQC
jgi:hypothetical protein